MLAAAAQNGWLDGRRAMLEVLTGIVRAGAQVVITYAAADVARWLGGKQAAVPQYHLWLYREDAVGRRIQALYDVTDPVRRREEWQWLLAWTAPPHEPQP